MELGWAAAHEDEVEVVAGELEGDALADAVGGAGDDGPRAVAGFEGLGGAEEEGVGVVEERGGEFGEGEEAEDEEEREEERHFFFLFFPFSKEEQDICT